MDRKHLLIVDDAPLIISRLTTLLEDLPCLASIDSAATVAEAVEKLSNSPLPDIVLLDINLPDRNGIDFLRQLHRDYSHIIVIMQSNQQGASYRNLCLQLGASYYIDKSTEFQLIPLILSTICSGSM
ncbi:MAG TPA: response regulator [Puia sp.]|uniref:response regulator n=1 Tax=Puia sp. TaxID=2045100 RepID=UPI002B7EA67A|nr:response regulator [Puia sp.]HVU94214.1 response regulator [Puia sp.]